MVDDNTSAAGAAQTAAAGGREATGSGGFSEVHEAMQEAIDRVGIGGVADLFRKATDRLEAIPAASSTRNETATSLQVDPAPSTDVAAAAATSSPEPADG